MYSSEDELRTPCMGRKVFHVEEHPKTFSGEMIALAKLALLAFPWVGIQSIWAAEFGATTPYLQTLGLGEFWSSNIWISGPIMGFFVAPVVGALSDHTTSVLGRRRPWMLGGLVFLGVVSLLLASSKKIFSDERSALLLAAPLFCILDGAINVIQTPTRAFLADFAPESKHLPGQLFASMFQGFGSMVGFGIQKAFYSEPDDVFLLFTMVFIVNLVVFCGVSFLVVEQPIKKPEVKQSLCKPLFHVFKDVRYMSRSLLKIGIVQAFSWIALFSYWPVASTWMAIDVMDGCPKVGKDGCTEEGYANYKEGIVLYQDMNLWNSGLQIVFSLLLSYTFFYGYIKRVRFIYSLGLFVGAVICILARVAPSVEMGRAIAVLFAIPVSVITSYPFAIVGRYNSEENSQDTGTQFGILNLFIVIPQLATTFVVSSMRSAIGDDQGLPWIMFFSGVNFLIAAIGALFIDESILEDDGEESATVNPKHELGSPNTL